MLFQASLRQLIFPIRILSIKNDPDCVWQLNPQLLNEQ